MKYQIEKDALHKAISIWKLSTVHTEKVSAEQLKEIVCIALHDIKKDQIKKIKWNPEGITIVEV